MITSLKENQVFVFGSNLNGHHAGGAARQAKESFGAIEGIGVGPQGRSYAIPTLDKNMKPKTLDSIGRYLEVLAYHASVNSHLEFLLTPIGAGIAGFSLSEIKSILPEFPPNVILVGDWD